MISFTITNPESPQLVAKYSQFNIHQWFTFGSPIRAQNLPPVFPALGNVGLKRYISIETLQQACDE
jgi:hypothetical protein